MHSYRAILLHNRAVFGYNTQIISISKKVCCALFTQNCASFSTLLDFKTRLDPEFSPQNQSVGKLNLLTQELARDIGYCQMLLQA